MGRPFSDKHHHGSSSTTPGSLQEILQTAMNSSHFFVPVPVPLETDSPKLKLNGSGKVVSAVVTGFGMKKKPLDSKTSTTTKKPKIKF